MATKPEHNAPFFHRLCAQAEAGRVLTAADVEDAVDDDPAAKRELAAMAERIRAGEDITISEFASRPACPRVRRGAARPVHRRSGDGGSAAHPQLRRQPMPARLDLSGVVGQEITASAVKDFLAEHAGEPVAMHLNSPGGIGVRRAWRRTTPSTTTARCPSLLTALLPAPQVWSPWARRHITMKAGALMMLHRAAAMTLGNAEAHRKSAGVLDKIDGEVIAIYASRTGMTRQARRRRARCIIFVRPGGAVDAGLADQVEAASSGTGASACAPVELQGRHPQLLPKPACRRCSPCWPRGISDHDHHPPSRPKRRVPPRRRGKSDVVKRTFSTAPLAPSSPPSRPARSFPRRLAGSRPPRI